MSTAPDDDELPSVPETADAAAPTRPPPEAANWARNATLAVVKPLERFLHVQAAGGIVLLLMAVTAMVWANSPWHESYHHLWHTKLTFGIGHWQYSESLHFWINDGLMVIFFFVVGLEIRREMHAGELSELKRAALPIIAAIGGMIVPAGIYIALNLGGSAAAKRGWGVPMATDIAFAVGILALLGKRVPAALRVLLLALAIIDDIGAILVIALFYSTGVQVSGLIVAVAGVVLVLLMQRMGLRNPFLYVVPGFIVWDGMLVAGVHPTIAGVIMGLLTPARSWFGEAGFLREATTALQEFRKRMARQHDQHDMLHDLQRLDYARREALPPVVRIEAALNPYVAWFIMPLFALSNAGVTVGNVSLTGGESSFVALGIGLGLAVGKPLGIVGASLLATKLGISDLPRGVNWRGLLVVGMTGGIGFTMALFIANLGFTDPALLGVAKLAVLIGSGAAGVAGLLIGYFLLSEQQEAGIAMSVDEAEQSTEL